MTRRGRAKGQAARALHKGEPSGAEAMVQTLRGALERAGTAVLAEVGGADVNASGVLALASARVAREPGPELARARAEEIGPAYELLCGLTPTIVSQRESGPRELKLGAPDTGANDARRRRGVYYTPGPLVEHLLDATLDPVMDAAERAHAEGADRARALLQLRVCDPACGGGAFLIGATRRLAARLALVRHGAAAGAAERAQAVRDVLRRCIFGVDIDPVALEMCRLALGLLAREGEQPTDAPGEVDVPGLRCGDALLGWGAGVEFAEVLNGRSPWSADSERGGFDVVVGNPPFLNQLRTRTAAARGSAALLREVSGGAVRGYADAAAAFLLLSSRLLRREGPGGGRAGLVLPRSLLVTRDAAPVRRAVLEGGGLPVHLWTCARAYFDASVVTCICVIERSGREEGVLSRCHGPEFARGPGQSVSHAELLGAPTWGELVWDPEGPPVAVGVASAPAAITGSAGAATIGDLAWVTADFRDQYYGLRGALIEDAPLAQARRSECPALVTSGLIDVGSCAWGTRATRVLGERWEAPRVDPRVLDGPMRRWLADRAVPKVLLATQTRVLEPTADEAGEFVPCVPVISVMPADVRHVWMLCAALASPVLTAVAARRYSGAGLSSGALKLSAAQVRGLPAPIDRGAARDAAELLRTASTQQDWLAFAITSCRSYGVQGEGACGLASWWLARAGQALGGVASKHRISKAM